MRAGTDLLRRVQAAFLEHGVSDLTMVGLARSSGVTRRTLYNYFSSREDAFRQAFWRLNIDLMDAAWQRGRSLQAEGAGALDIIAAIIDTRYGDVWRTLQPSPHADEIKGTVFHLCTDQMIEMAKQFQADMVKLIEELKAADKLQLKSGFTTVQLVQMLTDAARGVNQLYPASQLECLYPKYRDTCQAVLYGYAVDAERG